MVRSWLHQASGALQEEILFCHKQAQLTLAEICVSCNGILSTIGEELLEQGGATLQKSGSRDRWASKEAHADQ